MEAVTVAYTFFVLITQFITTQVVAQAEYQQMDNLNNFDNQMVNTFMVQCGVDNIHAISFKGEAVSVHSIHDEIHCQGEHISPLQHIIYNLSRPECGVDLGKNPDRAVVKVRVQEGNVILGTDKKYSISCVFDKAVNADSDSSAILVLDSNLFMDDQYDDSSILKTGISPNVCAVTNKLEILGFTSPPSLENRNPEIEVIDGADQQIILRINTDLGLAVQDMVPVITDCFVANTEPPSIFLWKFLTNGCGDGLVVPSSDHFVNKDKMKYEIKVKERNILSAMGNITVSCKIAYCSSEQNCYVSCPGASVLDISDITPVFMVDSRSVIINKIDLMDDKPPPDLRSDQDSSVSPSLTSRAKGYTTIALTQPTPPTTRATRTPPTTRATRTETSPKLTLKTSTASTSSNTNEGSKRQSELDKMRSSDEQKKESIFFIVIGLLSGAFVITLIVCLSLIVRMSKHRSGSGRLNYGSLARETTPSWIRSSFWKTGSMTVGKNEDPLY